MTLHRSQLNHISAFLTLVMLIVLPLGPVQAGEQKWKAGLRLGPAFYTQDLAENNAADGDTGFSLNVALFYRLHQHFSAGAMLEFETHSVESDARNLQDAGSVNTVTLLPFVLEVNPVRISSFEPYVTLGLGVNINSFSESTALENLAASLGAPGTEFSLDNTLAFRVGAGADYYVTEKIALNAELAWKLNSGDTEIEGPGFGFRLGDFDASAIGLLFGARMAF